MQDKPFETLMAWGDTQGAQLHRLIERRCVNGVWGMYASGNIRKGEVIARFPKDKLLKPVQNFDYPQSTPDKIKVIHTAACELNKGELCWPGLSNLYSLNDLQGRNAYFYSDEELGTLSKLGQGVYGYALEVKKEVDAIVSYVCDMDKSLATPEGKEHLLRVVLNYNSRAWRDGFVPILDMFNHSDKLGCLRQTDQVWTFFTAAYDYYKDDQIWVSYGQKDLYLHAINYGYFDPSGNHCIDIGFRITQWATTDFQKHLFHYIKSRYKVMSGKDEKGHLYYKLPMGVAMLLDNAPNVTAIDFLRDLSFRSGKELKARKYESWNFRERMLQYIDALSAMNNIDDVELHDIPEKMQYFFHMLKKEKEMLVNNKEWVLTNSPKAGLTLNELELKAS